MKAGETVRADCSDCDTEFEVTFEPKAKGVKGHGIKSQKIAACPFCGSMSGVADEEGDDDE